MGREGWIYALVFVAVLGAGAALILPRLERMHDDGARRDAPGGAVTPEPAVVEPEVPTPPPPTPVRVRVRGVQGPLRAPLKPVVGADVSWIGAPDARIPELELLPTAPRVAIGAPGHQWVELDAAALPAGDDEVEVVLPDAATPLVVRVREVDGRPAADVPVAMWPAGPDGTRRTDRGGTLVIDDAAPGLLELDVGGTERAGPALRLLAGVDRETDAVLEPAWRVTGRLVDEAGSPVAGAAVRGIGREGEVGRAAPTGADGAFAWRGPAESLFALRLEAPGRAPRHVEVRPPVAGPLATAVGDVVVGPPGARLRVLVRGSAEAPEATLRAEPAVAAWLRELFGPDAALTLPWRAQREGAEGFVLEDLPGGLPLRLAVRGAGLGLDHLLTLAPGQPTEIELAPPPGHVLTGRLVDGPGDAAVRGGRVLVSVEPRAVDQVLEGDRVAITDREGRFALRGLPAGAFHLRAFAPGRRPARLQVTLPRGAPVELRLEAAGPAALEGTVADDAGTPLAGVTIRAAGQRTRSDAEGRWRLDGLAAEDGEVAGTAGYEPGPVPAGADPRRTVPGARFKATPGGPPVALVLPRAAGLRLRLLDGVDDVPLAHVHLVVSTDEGDLLVDRAFAPHDGVVELTGLPPRGVVVSAITWRHRLVVPVPLAPGEVQDLGDQRVPRGMHITGRVVDANDHPLAGARVGAVEPGWTLGRAGDPALRRELLLRHATADDEGRFVLEGLDPRKPATLSGWAPGLPPAAARVVLETFRDDVHAEVTIRLRPGGGLEVDLRDARTNEPVPWAVFDLEDARTGADYLDLLRRGMLSGPVATDDEWTLASTHLLMEKEVGLYRVGPVTPGPYEVWVEAQGYASLRKRLSILDPEDGVVDVVGGTSRGIVMLRQTWALDPAIR